MASNSPESASKKRKQPIIPTGLKRDHPLFASRRSAPTLQQPPEFLTESLNTSYIPSPSPERSPTRQSLRAKPRQAANWKSLTAAFIATANPQYADKLSFHPSRRLETQPRKSQPTQASSHATAQAANKKPTSSGRPRTPTPPRGRQVIDLTSPTNSESSPGRGYAEAYQRIVEEENLAQEDSVHEADMDGFEYSYDGQPQNTSQKRLQPKQSSSSPTSFKTSRRASPRSLSDARAAKDGKDGIANKENIVNDGGSEADDSHGDDMTISSLDSSSSQYAKDLQRLNGALKNGPTAFSKARLGERKGLTVENLARRKASDESLRSTQSADSCGHNGSDPGVNIPKAWGRKARPGKDWLSRINSRSGKLTGDVPKRHSLGKHMMPDNGKRGGVDEIDDWVAAAAGVPLPDGENGSSLTTSSSTSTPVPVAEQANSVDRRRGWEMEDDFTGRSLQVSESPPIRIRDAAVHRVRGRGMGRLEKQAVTTSRLGELRESTSEEHMQKVLPDLSSPDSPLDTDSPVHSTAQRMRYSPPFNGQSKPHSSDADTIEADPGNDLVSEGDPVRNIPAVNPKRESRSDSLIGINGDSTKDIQASPRAARRPSHERRDSHDLLKRLARAASDSPSPDKDQSRAEEHSIRSEENTEHAPELSNFGANIRTPVVTGAWVDHTAGKTPQSFGATVNLKTPFVTGAWIDTPLPTGGRGPPMPTPADVEDQKELGNGRIGANDLIKKLSPTANPTRPLLRPQEPLVNTATPLPKSALENIVINAKGSKSPLIPANSESEEDPTLHLGESTIQSLEDMIANDTDFSTILAPTPQSPQTSPPSTDPSAESKPAYATKPEPSESANPDSYTQILSRLKSLAPSLRDSKKQISSLEKAVAKAPSSSLSRDLATQDTCDEAGEIHDFIWPCQKCGCPGRMEPDLDGLLNIRGNLTSVRIPIPRLWCWRQGDQRPHFTWLGLLTMIAWGLVVAEAWARTRYCHPLYATSMIGYGVDINAPRPPFVLIKVIYHKTALGSVLAPFYHLSRIAFKLFASLLGYAVGFISGDERGSENIRQPVSRDQRIPRPNRGPDLRMLDDEYI
ncbi:MAG: hypothetical protein Q9163_003702 [Psora crenata]